MSSLQQDGGTQAGSQQASRGVEPQAELDPRLLRVCCGNRIVPQLAEIRRPDEPALFVSVWPCPVCHRVTH